MDDILAVSPESSASDSDSYNTESARLYFGPLKTPERKFVASSQRLFPPMEVPPLRRSPRLSSPRPRSTTPIDHEFAAEESQNIQLVAQLVNEVDEDEDDEDMSNSQCGTPQTGAVLPDEPSSALADKILHALDNPSPPPSPPAALSIFDPYHTTTPEPLADYQSDLMSLTISDGVERDDENPPLVITANAGLTSLLLSTPPSGPALRSSLAQQDLISFDSFSTSPLLRSGDKNTVLESSTIGSEEILSVDDMLTQSPRRNSSDHQQNPQVPVLVIHSPIDDGVLADGELMSIDVCSSPRETAAKKEPTPTLPITEQQEEQGQEEKQTTATQTNSQPILGEALITTPLRRSTRPRRSVTPNPPLIPPVFIAPPSSARTLVKKKAVSTNTDEDIVSDSEDEQGRLRRSPSRATPTVTRVRHRSPGKVPLSFQRELGSLSPTSASVLSTLGFASADEPNGTADLSTNQAPSSPNPPTMFSFSVFSSETPAPPSTPIRSDGPIRIASPAKVQVSPTKFRLQTPAPNDPINTPARRIPLEQAVAQGHVSPEKAVQLGFKPNGTPLPSVSTPARRVLVSERPAHVVAKSGGHRFGSPGKTISTQRERSAEPSQRIATSLKGKEKASFAPQESSSSVIKPGQLPFPLIPSVPASSVASSSTLQGQGQDIAVKPISSPAKSSLKQVTSRIPRIGTKPYGRAVDLKAGEKTKRATTTRMVDLAKLPPKLTVMESVSIAKKHVWGPEAAKGASSSISSVKPTVSTSTTLLKRKREAEKVSPVKPRIIMLRQVPLVVAHPNEPSTSSQAVPAPAPSLPAKNKKPPQGSMRIRRVVDPVPNNPVVLQPAPPAQITPSEPAAPTIVYKPRQAAHHQPANEATSSTEPLPQNSERDDLTPGSPMKQDPPNALQSSVQERTEPTALPSAPTILVTDTSSTADSHSISNLRRTTRSRRPAIIQDVFSERSSRPSTSRRKAASFHSDDVFSGMSMTALKDLTISNTVKNQRYLAAKLETEVVRKEGVRPESPAVKIRTIIQRQQEDQEKDRAERAKRRARRSDEMATSDIEASSDVGYSSPCGDQSSNDKYEPLMKHQRGAGEEDDYETPERPNGHLPRMRLFDDGDMQPSRRVKWDRGLFTTVYIDEVKLGSRQTLKENRSLKGILAPTAKALRLDTLGNLPQADSPLADLVQENITVKKFVYDNDVAAVPDIAVVKNTRSKSKRK